MRRRAFLPALALAVALTLAGCGQQPSGGTDEGPSTSSGSRGSSPDPTTTVPSATEIPDDFPLSAGMGAAQDPIATSRSGTGLRDLELCGTAPLRGLGVRDRMIADNSGGESANTRELVLLGTPEEAALVARAFTDLPVACAARTEGDLETVTEVRASPFGPAPAATLLQTYTFDGEPGTGATVVHVVQVGAALLVTSTYGEWSGDTLEAGVDETVDAVRQTVAALAPFDSDGTANEPESESDTPPAGPTEIPDDFPLAVGLPEGDADVTIEGPSADGVGMGEVEVEMCGRVVWPILGTAGGTRRLVTGALGPEFFDGRELVVHADAEVAGTAMASIRQAAQDCRRSGNQVWTVLDRDTGYDTVTMGLSYSDGLGSSVFQVTRVGSARLMVQTYGEGSIESLDSQADEVTSTTAAIVAAMCAFTKAGC